MDTHRFKTRDLCVKIQNRDFSVTVEECQPLSVIDWTKLADNNLTSWRSWVYGFDSLPKPDQPEFHRNLSLAPPTNASLPCTASVSNGL
jgi:hypothetical protein